MEPTILADRHRPAEPGRQHRHSGSPSARFCCNAVDAPVDKSVGKAPPCGELPGQRGDPCPVFRNKSFRIKWIRRELVVKGARWRPSCRPADLCISFDHLPRFDASGMRIWKAPWRPGASEMAVVRSRAVAIATRQISPRAAIDTGSPLPITRWSSTRTPTRRSASRSSWVIARSAALGSATPEG